MKSVVAGFTLIEILALIVVIGLMVNIYNIGVQTILINTPKINNQKIALQSARGCMEWYIMQRISNGYSVYSCPSTPSPTNCTAPAGFTITTNITCTSLNSDNNYKTITVSVSGLAAVSLTTLIGNY